MLLELRKEILVILIAFMLNNNIGNIITKLQYS